MKLDRFYPIFDSVEWLERLLPLGIKLVQLRIKDASETVLLEQIQSAKRLCKRYKCQLIVNDYWDLAIEQGCDFVHVGQEDLDMMDWSQVKKANLKLGISTHDDAELQRALSYKPSYIALGPVYPTILKKMKIKQQGLNKVTEWKQKIGDLPLVAIGGMTVENSTGAFDAGADIVSAVTDITLNSNPETRVKQWLNQTR